MHSRPRIFAVLVLLAAALAAAPAGAAEWQAVPGSGELQVDLASLQAGRSVAVAWVRSWGRSPLVPDLALLQSGLRVQRTTFRAEFDCGRRTLRVLAAQAQGSGGTPVFLSSTPGPAMPVEGGDLLWAYDAVCEAARALGLS